MKMRNYLEITSYKHDITIYDEMSMIIRYNIFSITSMSEPKLLWKTLPKKQSLVSPPTSKTQGWKFPKIKQSQPDSMLELMECQQNSEQQESYDEETSDLISGLERIISDVQEINETEFSENGQQISEVNIKVYDESDSSFHILEKSHPKLAQKQSQQRNSPITRPSHQNTQAKKKVVFSKKDLIHKVVNLIKEIFGERHKLEKSVKLNLTKFHGEMKAIIEKQCAQKIFDIIERSKRSMKSEIEQQMRMKYQNKDHINQIKNSYENIEKQLQKSKIKIENYQETIFDLKQKLVEQEIDYKEKVEDLKKSENTSSMKVKYEDMITQYQEKITNLSNEVNTLGEIYQRQLEIKEEIIRKEKSKLEEKTKEMEERQQYFQERENEIHELLKHIEENREQLEEKSQELMAMDQFMKEKMKEMEKIEEELSRGHHNLEQMKKKYEHQQNKQSLEIPMILNLPMRKSYEVPGEVSYSHQSHIEPILEEVSQKQTEREREKDRERKREYEWERERKKNSKISNNSKEFLVQSNLHQLAQRIRSPKKSLNQTYGGYPLNESRQKLNNYFSPKNPYLSSHERSYKDKNITDKLGGEMLKNLRIKTDYNDVKSYMSSGQIKFTKSQTRSNVGSWNPYGKTQSIKDGGNGSKLREVDEKLGRLKKEIKDEIDAIRSR